MYVCMDVCVYVCMCDERFQTLWISFVKLLFRYAAKSSTMRLHCSWAATRAVGASSAFIVAFVSFCSSAVSNCSLFRMVVNMWISGYSEAVSTPMAVSKSLGASWLLGGCARAVEALVSLPAEASAPSSSSSSSVSSA